MGDDHGRESRSRGGHGVGRRQQLEDGGAEDRRRGRAEPWAVTVGRRRGGDAEADGRTIETRPRRRRGSRGLGGPRIKGIVFVWVASAQEDKGREAGVAAAEEWWRGR